MELRQTRSATRSRQVRDNASGRSAETLARLMADGRFGPETGVTCRGKTDGVGAQAMAAISAMAMAKLAGCRYYHSPFTSMSHAESGREDWARRWERFLDLGAGERPVPVDVELVSLAAAVANPDAYAGRSIVIAERVFGLPQGIGWPIRDRLRDELRAKYWGNAKEAIPSHRAAAGLTAAIHVRRGDVSQNRHSQRYLTDAAVLRQIDRLRRATAPFGQGLTVNVYSEGAAEGFRAFAEAGCKLHISADTFETFHNLVTADILVSATSTFSYVAGLLSRGIVLDHRGRAPEIRNWLHRRPDGDIPIKRLRLALLEGTGWKERAQYRVRLWRQIWNERRAAH